MTQIKLFKNNNKSLFESNSNFTEENADIAQSTTSLKSVIFPAPTPNQAPVITGPTVLFTYEESKGFANRFLGNLTINDTDNGGNWNGGSVKFSISNDQGYFLADKLFFYKSPFSLNNGVMYYRETAISGAFQVTSVLNLDANKITGLNVTFNSSATNEIVQYLLQSMTVVQNSDNTYVNVTAIDQQNASTNYSIKLELEKAPVITIVNGGNVTIEKNQTKSLAEIIDQLYDPNGAQSWQGGGIGVNTENLENWTSTLPTTPSAGYWASLTEYGADIYFGSKEKQLKIATLYTMESFYFGISFEQAIENEAIKELLSYFHFSLSEGNTSFTIRVSDRLEQGNEALINVTAIEANSAPTGNLNINGSLEKGQTLSVSNTLVDADGLGKISYQWFADGKAITDATSANLVLDRYLVGKTISVEASYTDGAGKLERVQSTPTTKVIDPNSSFSGNVYIKGQATQGETLTATHNLNDPDGMGTVVYQWNSNGLAIAGANQSTLKLDDSHVGKLISVTAAFIDGKGSLESTTYGLNGIVGSNLQGGNGNEVFKGTAGHDIINGGAGNDTVQFNGKLADYTIKNVNGKFIVTDKSGNDGIDTLSNIETLKFADMSMNLTIQGKLPSAPSANQLKLIELYIAFFNRIPDADGLSYWIDQFNGGMTIVQIAESFYQAGLAYSKETGYTSTMSNADFVNIIYKNTLGRKDGADADGLKYWSEQLASGKATRGSLVNDILNSAHSFKGKADYGWVADLLDNKVTVGKTVAVDWGITFNTPEESISKGMAIAAAVTATDYQAALKLVGINSIDIGLTGVAPLETGFALM